MNVEDETQPAIEAIEEAGDGPAVDLGGVATILEALLLAAEGPLSMDALHKLVGMEFNLGRRELREALALLAERYAASAAELLETASGWRLQVRAEHSVWVSRLWQEKPPKYSRAALETLALIVYRQPITRGEIEDVRGVAVSTNILRTLVERGWVRELGQKEVPGRPTLYGTTPQLLDDLGLKSLDQLPSLPDVKDLEALDAALARLGAGMPSSGEEDGDEGDGAGPAESIGEVALPGESDPDTSAAPPTLH